MISPIASRTIPNCMSYLDNDLILLSNFWSSWMLASLPNGIATILLIIFTICFQSFKYSSGYSWKLVLINPTNQHNIHVKATTTKCLQAPSPENKFGHHQNCQYYGQSNLHVDRIEPSQNFLLCMNVGTVNQLNCSSSTFKQLKLPKSADVGSINF